MSTEYVKKLDDEEIADLKQLTKHREWTVLLKLFRNIERDVALEFESFKTPEDGLRLQGKLQGVRLGVEVVTNLYGGVIEHERSSYSSHRPPEARYTGIGIDPNPADAEPIDASY